MSNQKPTSSNKIDQVDTEAACMRAGGLGPNHSEEVRVRTGLRVSGIAINHNEAVRVRPSES